MCSLVAEPYLSLFSFVPWVFNPCWSQDQQGFFFLEESVMQKNQKVVLAPIATYGGSAAVRITAEKELRRSVLATMLWENQFYENGEAIADRIEKLSTQVSPQKVAEIALEAKEVQKLRHVPLLLASALVRPAAGTGLIRELLPKILTRADELGEFLALYWRKGKTPLAKQVKAGLAQAFTQFDAYQLAKYDRAKTVRLRDVLFLTHAKPKNEQQAAIWKQLVDGTLPSADTWEVALSTGEDAKASWERLLSEGKLGYLALLRNLRNMEKVGVDEALIRKAILARKGAEKVLPFRFIGAARAAPSFERELDQALVASLQTLPRFEGKTVLLVDVSGSMSATLSDKSDLSRMDAAASLAAIFPSDDVKIYSFADRVVQVPARVGLAGIDAIRLSQPHGCTALAQAVQMVNQKHPDADRVIVITDEQGTDGRVPDPLAQKAYMINVASYKNGVGYGKWTHLDGFSEGVLRWMAEFEKTA